MSDAWRDMTAAELGRAIAAGRIDPVELTEVFLAAIAAHPNAGRIYARLSPERARAEAAAARVRARSGQRAGPLDGVPISWKDLFDTAGSVTEAGTGLLSGRVPDEDAECLAHASRAGSVCLGKTHLTEIAFSGLGVNPMTATPPNHFAPTRAPGGSSSGAAVSVSAGLAAMGIGSDTGGSVRIPAAWNGLVGLKTTAGLVSTRGAVALSRSLDTVGPLTRSVEDAALGLGLLTGGPAPEIEAQTPGDIALYLPETAVLDDCDPEIETGFADALDRLGRAGARIARGPLALLAETLAPARVGAVVGYEAWQEWGGMIETNPGVMYSRIEARCRTGEAFDAAANAAATADYDRLSAELARFIGAPGAGQGLLVMPSTACIAPELARLLADEDYFVSRNLLALRNTRVANMLRTCAITLPTGHPMVGLMLVARPGEEARLLAAGAALAPILGG